MDASLPLSFDALPPEAQQRITALAERHSITCPQAMVVIMLLSKGTPLQDITHSLQKAGCPLTRSDLNAIRQEIDSWIPLATRRLKVAESLKNRGLLTEERRLALEAAPTPEALLAIYLAAAPLSGSLQTQQSDSQPAWSQILDGVDLFQLVDFLGDYSETISNAWNSVRSTASDAAEGAGDLLSNAWDSISISSLFDSIDL